MKILHITTHLGGGVGKAIIGMASHKSAGVETKIIVLEEPEKRKSLEQGIEKGIPIFVCPNMEMITSFMVEADIVIINWWNHPLMSKFLNEIPQVDCRLVAWVHVNGCTYPYIPFEFLDQFSYVFFTSKYSYENELFLREELENLKAKSSVILGNGDFWPDKMQQKKEYLEKEEFRLGYIGTLNYSKIHENYVQYCEAAIGVCPNLKIVLAGDLGNDLKQDIEKSTYSEHFEILGYVEDVEEVYLSFDALGYILNEDNYGTTENVLLEAMAYGLPILVYDGGVERNIIDHEKNGFLVQNTEEFALYVKLLQNDTKLQYELGCAAREKACCEFSSDSNYKRYEESCRRICSMPTKVYDFTHILGQDPIEWFLHFTGKDKNQFEDYLICPNEMTKERLRACKPIYKGERKSSIKHFFSYFPEDLQLEKMVKEIEEGR